MPAARGPLPVAALALWLAFSGGCRSPARPDPELDALLQRVSYDIPVPPMQAPVPLREQLVPAPEPADASSAEGEKTFGRTVGDGLKATAGLLFLGTMKLVGAAFGLDDDDNDNDRSALRGEADRSMNDWLESRRRWRSGERGF